MAHECKALEAKEGIRPRRDSGFYKMGEQMIRATKTATVTQSVYFNGWTMQIYNTVRVGRDTWDEEETVFHFAFCLFCGERMEEE